VNCVITPYSNAEEVFYHFVDELGIKTFDLSSPIMDWGSFDETRVQQVKKFYSDLLEMWLKRNDPAIRIGAFSAMLTALLTDAGAEAYARARSHSVPTFTIRSDGSLCPDDALSPKAEAYSRTGFSVERNGLREFLDAGFWQDIHVAYVLPRGDCESCKWAGLCGGGLAEHRFSPGEGFSRKSTYCEARMALCNNLYDYVRSVLPSGSVDRRLQAIQHTLLAAG
jgi:radical SAM protein with 4Fe4S-binding SPASM domain